jgi:hypothetical protein
MGQIEVKRVVIDTNVVVSALLFGRVPGRLMSRWERGSIRPHASKEIVDEYIRVLAYPKFELTEHEIDFLVYGELLAHFEIVEVLPAKPIVRSDPADDKFIWCAETAGIDIIISGDTHLLRMKTYGEIRIMSPAKFLETFFPHES